MVTSDPVRDRMVPFTRSMSAVKNPIRRAMEGGEGFSNGTMTAKGSLQEARTRDNRNAMVGGQVRRVAVHPGVHAPQRIMWRVGPDGSMSQVQDGRCREPFKESLC